MNNILKMCMNWRVLAAVAVGALLLAVVVPGFSAALPVLLIVALCPIMMFVMMNGMNGKTGETHNGSSDSSPQSERTANANRNATPPRSVAELKAEQRQISLRIAELEASQSPTTLGTIPAAQRFDAAGVKVKVKEQQSPEAREEARISGR